MNTILLHRYILLPAALIWSVTWLLIPLSVYGCSCGDSYLTQIQEGFLIPVQLHIFAGTLATSTFHISPNKDDFYRFRRDLYFNIERVWRGNPEIGSVKVITAGMEASCGWNVDNKDTPYVIFAWQREDGSLHTGLCNGNHELEGSTIPELLGPGVEPLPGNVITPEEIVQPAVESPNDSELKPRQINVSKEDEVSKGMLWRSFFSRMLDILPRFIFWGSERN